MSLGTTSGNAMKTIYRNRKRETLSKYIQILIDAKIIHKCERFDLKSRKSIGGEQKYYLTDLGFYFAANTDNRINYGPVLENIVYIYMKNPGGILSASDALGKWNVTLLFAKRRCSIHIFR